MITSIARAFVALAAVLYVVSSFTPAYAGDRDLVAKSTRVLAAEIDGLGVPDAKFAIASRDFSPSGTVEELAKQAPVGDQGKSTQQAQYRSSGCSTGCSVGCSTGCSSGCSVGCSTGCSSGCSVGCSSGCSFGCR